MTVSIALQRVKEGVPLEQRRSRYYKDVGQK